jgi:uncharacterized damage-inducible protein DinB
VQRPPATEDSRDGPLRCRRDRRSRSEGYRSTAREEFKSFLDTLSDEELAKVQDFDIDGDTVRYSYGELLTHLLLHERGHHGDVSTLFYQMGLEIPMTEYRFHLGRFDYD